MRRAAAILFAFLGLAVESGAAGAASAFAPEVVERGRYLSIAADCAACHTAPAGSPFAGGYALASPFGAIYSSNITPSKEYGIGRYSESQFASALREGVRADGAHLYPAMPYASYTALSDADVHAIYAYFMQAVAPVERAAPETTLAFPFNVRPTIAVWNALFVNDVRFAEDPARSAQWNRGAYLVGALEHCGECHTPRGPFMQSRYADALGGGRVGEWLAPDITSDPVRGIGSWKPDEIVAYLKTGRLDGKARAAGGMAEAVTHSLSRLSDDDLQAIAAYLLTVRSVAHRGTSKPATDWGRPVSSEATLRGAVDPPEGASLYSGLCASCHEATGRGTPDQVIPSLFHNSTVGAEHPDNLIAVILHGVDREAGGQHVAMPGFGEGSYVQPLTDAQVAAVANHVRMTYGPGMPAITEADVATTRQGGPPSSLPMLARDGAAIVVLLALALLGIRWKKSRRRGQEDRS